MSNLGLALLYRLATWADNFSSCPRDVHVYDARFLKSRGSQPLISLTEHSKSIASAYFSPVTGNRVVTTCADCKLR